MSSLQNTRPGAFTYTLHELASRDEVVFKSVLRVLQGKTRHAWQHTEGGDADVVVRSRGCAAPAPSSDFGHSQPVAHPDITVSTAGGTACRVLAWPLRIAELIDCLDQAGDEIASLARRVLPQASAATAAPAAATARPDTGAVPPRWALPATQRMVLTRWPGQALLQRDVRYLKLATVLTGQPVSLLEMAERTGFELQLCRDFVNALHAESLVRLLDGAVRPAHANPAAAQAQRPGAQPGLIARIRLRLEMIIRAPAAK